MTTTYLFFTFAFMVLMVSLSNCSVYGKNPEGEDLLRIQKSPQYDSEKQSFVNRIPNVLDEMKRNSTDLALIKEFFFGSGNRVPNSKLPERKPPDLPGFLEPTDGIKFIWMGHSTLLINFQNKILMVDPVLSGSASPFSFLVKRFQPPVLSINELPEIDIVLISHDHYDHLDMETISSFRDKKTKFITPLGVGSHLVSWGITKDRIEEKDWWESLSTNDLKFTCTPAQHFSGRTGMDSGKTLWASWVIESEDKKIYFSGDSGYDIHFKEIGGKFGPIDLVFMENGQYNERWKEVHLLPRETSQAFLDVKGKVLVPIHWGMFELSLHDWYEPVEESERYASEMGIELWTPELGQVMELEKQNIITKWWKDLIGK
ncbi:MAG: MBL fold metallo-hydrolase [Leptospiraceae bacterium]|nr:MBL fold metallo-hydrolase [Leptospiraceae bacterium]MCP5513197.1 MBL fold metallo-hydrolase [Leptospiraceae bacterium]